MNDIEYQIYGEELQFVELELAPGQTVYSEAGAMVYMSPHIEMSARLDYGNEGGMFKKVISLGKRIVSGESFFVNSYHNTSRDSIEKVAFAAPYPGTIVPIELTKYGHLICQKDAYLCSSAGIDVDISFAKKMSAGLFGGEGFILQKLTGFGTAFIHACGAIHRMYLTEGESLLVDTGCIVAFQESVHYDVEFVGGVKNALFGGEGLFFARVQGPGYIFVQSMPFSRFANKLYESIPQLGGKKVGEGSIVEIGNLGVKGD